MRLGTDALSRAFDTAERITTACKASTLTAERLLAAGPQGIALHQPNMLRAREQYRHNKGWAYVAIRAISQRIAGQSLNLARVAATQPVSTKLADARRALFRSRLPRGLKSLGDNLEPIENHPLLAAVDRPNPLMVRWSLMCFTVASLELCGRAFWWLNDTGGNLEIWPIPCHWIEAVDTLRSAWRVLPDGYGFGEEFIIPAEDVAYFPLVDAANPFGSMSPLQSQATAVAADEAIQQAQFRAFKDGIFPGVIIKAGRLPGMAPGQPGERPVLEPEQRAELVDAIKAIAGGAWQYGQPFIVDGMIEDIQKFTLSPQEMDFLESGNATKSRIFQAFGVNPLIVGEIEGANRAQATVAEESFCSNTVNPLLELMSQILTEWIGVRFALPGERLICWFDDCRAHDPEQSLKEWQVGLQYGATTLNEFRTTILGLPPEDRFEIVMAPATMIER